MALVQKSFSDLITFTRASGGGRFNSQGQYEWLPANVPRIDYDPVTGECLGLLVEESRTNLIPNSDTSGGPWSGGGDRVLGAPTGLPGVFAAGASMAQDASANAFNYYQALSPVAGTTYTFSVFVRFADGRDVNAEFGNPTVENTALNPFTLVANGAASTWSTIQKKHVGGGLWRLSHTVTTSDNLFRGWGILIRTTHKEGLPRLFVTGYQLEQASSPSSYIPTTNAQVTRAADIPSVNTLSPWFNSLEGTLFVEASTRNTSYATIAQLTDGTADNELRLIGWNDTSNRLAVAASGSPLTPTLNGLSPWVPRDGSSIKVAAAWGASEFVYAGNGGAPKVQSSSLQPVGLNRLNLGYSSVGGFRLNGHIRSIRYFPRRLSDAELQALTA